MVEYKKWFWENNTISDLLFSKNYLKQFNILWDSEKITDKEYKEYSQALTINASDYFDIWWDPDRFNWDECSNDLAQYCSEYFNTWWDPNKFNYKNGSLKLVQYCSKYFEEWWDPNKFNYKNGASQYLATNNIKKIETWWNPDKFDWSYTDTLIRVGHDYFDIWWNPDKIKWTSYIAEQFIRYLGTYMETWWTYASESIDYDSSIILELIVSCSKTISQFKLWWDPNIFDWYYSSHLAEHCGDYFDIWWDPDKFRYNVSNAKAHLIKYCSKYFETWWDPQKIVINNYTIIYALAKHCFEYFEKWWDPKICWIIINNGGIRQKYAVYDALFNYCNKYKNIWNPIVS